MFAREVWTMVLHYLGKPDWLPAIGKSLSDWCRDKAGSEQCKRDARVLIILVMWELWKHRNTIVFDGATPSKNYVILMIVEGRTWK